MIIACMPVDRSQLPEIPEVDAIVITDLYTLKECHQCGQSIWVGPRQKEAWEKAHISTALLCFLCAADFVVALQKEEEGPVALMDLGGGSTREGRPRTL